MMNTGPTSESFTSESEPVSEFGSNPTVTTNEPQKTCSAQEWEEQSDESKGQVVGRGMMRDEHN